MDAEVGDAGQRTVGADQTTLDAALGTHQQTACHGQRTVEPGGHDHAAVALDLGLGEDLVLRVILWELTRSLRNFLPYVLLIRPKKKARIW